jgi:hypothetical protein
LGHTEIGVIVYATDEKDARSEAESILDNLCGDGRAFDYYDIDAPRTPAISADSPEGKLLINDMMDDTRNDFMKHLKAVREVLDFFSDEELYNTEMGSFSTMTLKLKNDQDLIHKFASFNYHYNCLSRYEGPDVRLYDQYGNALGNPESLKEALEKSDDPKLAGESLFVVLAVMHS